MRTTLTIPDKQMAQIDRIAQRLGMRRGQTLNYLLTLALSHEQFRGASIETADGTLILARLAEKEMEEWESYKAGGAVEVPVLVTPGQRLKNETGEAKKRGRKTA